MQLLTPDPTFYPSPAMATQAPPETLGYVALVNPREGGADALGVVDLDPASKSYGRLIGQTDMPYGGTSSITSAGTPAAPASVPTRLIRTWSGATSWCRASTHPAFTFLTRSPIPDSRES